MLLWYDFGFDASVECHTFFGVVGGAWLGFAIAFDVEACSVDAMFDEVVDGGFGSVEREGVVVLLGGTAVGVSADFDSYGWVFFHDTDKYFEFDFAFGFDLVFVGVEVDVAQGDFLADLEWREAYLVGFEFDGSMSVFDVGDVEFMSVEEISFGVDGEEVVGGSWHGECEGAVVEGSCCGDVFAVGHAVEEDCGGYAFGVFAVGDVATDEGDGVRAYFGV